MSHWTQVKTLQLDIIALACLVALCGGALLWGCSQAHAPNELSVLVPDRVRTALDEMDRRGLTEWAEYGRSIASCVTYGGEMPGFWAYTDLSGKSRIYVSDRWVRADVGDRGLVLLHEIWHAQTGIVSHPQELTDLLAMYRKG